jgi:protocatechuate 3,4-dioxygenase beta subunit
MSDQQERLNAIWVRTVEKLKEVVREFKVTEDELHEAGDYLNRLGQSGMCRSLLDVALAMTAVAVHAPPHGGTRKNLEGPYHTKHPDRPDGKLYEHDPGKQPRFTMSGTVTDVRTGKPIPGAKLDVWQTDYDGIYDRKGMHLRGIVTADANGHYVVHSVLPNDYAEHDHDPIGELFRAMGKPNTRAAHVHIKISVGDELWLTTQIFMPFSKFLTRDYVEGAVMDELMVKLEKDQSSAGAEAWKARFDFAVAPPQA